MQIATTIIHGQFHATKFLAGSMVLLNSV